MTFIEQLLHQIGSKPFNSKRFFRQPLSLKNRLEIEGLIAELQCEVCASMDRAMEQGAEIIINAEERSRLLELMKIQNEFMELLSGAPALKLN